MKKNLLIIANKRKQFFSKLKIFFIVITILSLFFIFLFNYLKTNVTLDEIQMRIDESNFLQASESIEHYLKRNSVNKKIILQKISILLAQKSFQVNLTKNRELIYLSHYYKKNWTDDNLLIDKALLYSYYSLEDTNYYHFLYQTLSKIGVKNNILNITESIKLSEIEASFTFQIYTNVIFTIGKLDDMEDIINHFVKIFKEKKNYQLKLANIYIKKNEINKTIVELESIIYSSEHDTQELRLAVELLVELYLKLYLYDKIEFIYAYVKYKNHNVSWLEESYKAFLQAKQNQSRDSHQTVFPD